MSGFYRSMEYIATKMNNAKSTKQSIITAVDSYEYIQNKVREIAEKAKQETAKQKPEEIHFDPNEIESIVLKNRGEEER